MSLTDLFHNLDVLTSPQRYPNICAHRNGPCLSRSSSSGNKPLKLKECWLLVIFYSSRLPKSAHTSSIEWISMVQIAGQHLKISAPQRSMNHVYHRS
ncbi:Bgt-20128 [Blumeria graminis f. sp. tritici]|uniref:Bgt-20128 n=2 Tax=Blumeria graminis f. sp. tritici TaxID=62690 RepID=A0A9X9MP95_BLUGR|nr:Bgt-20128 [Blumeria graminis f. sp. tritici]